MERIPTSVMFPRTIVPAAVLLAFALPRAVAEEGADFFEKRVRPLLIERCYECHSSEKKVKGGAEPGLKRGVGRGRRQRPRCCARRPGEERFH
jgi:hypothetical protein